MAPQQPANATDRAGWRLNLDVPHACRAGQVQVLMICMYACLGHKREQSSAPLICCRIRERCAGLTVYGHSCNTALGDLKGFRLHEKHLQVAAVCHVVLLFQDCQHLILQTQGNPRSKAKAGAENRRNSAAMYGTAPTDLQDCGHDRLTGLGSTSQLQVAMAYPV